MFLLYLEWDLINLVTYSVQENKFYLVLMANLENFKPGGYFLRIKNNSGKFLVTQKRFFDSKIGNPVMGIKMF